ncbi:MAG TPA: hypothetical protein VHS54_04500 [Jatrophihabitans sp.]|jgi:hypothetical protein|nr:hypothetical protein [Jatrophihabitans sp.]
MAAQLRRIVHTSAAVLGLVALLLPSAGAAGATAASTATHVAIVIAGHGTACVRAGATGDAILNEVAQVAYRPSDHLIWQIDGQPQEPFADTRHYWSYWHDVGGSWQYSSFGASSYQPAPGTVEGWSYVNGQSSAPPPPWNPGGLYAAICGALDPKPAPSTTHRTTARPAPSTLTRRPGSPATTRSRTAAPTPTPTPTPTRSVDASSTAVTSRATVSPSRTPAHPAPVAASSRPATGSSPSTDDPISPLAQPPRGSAGSPVPAVIGLALVALVGAGGVWTAMRRRRTG